jgi:putative FmdB family regulatory protein
MPIYEFECQQCGRHFETLVRGTTKLACPSCQGLDLTRMLSVFAVGGRDTNGTEKGSCDTCCDPRRLGSCCSMN